MKTMAIPYLAVILLLHDPIFYLDGLGEPQVADFVAWGRVI